VAKANVAWGGCRCIGAQAANLVAYQAVSMQLTRKTPNEGGVTCDTNLWKNHFFEPMSKRRRGYPSEAKVKIGLRVVSGDKLLEEKLGRNDLCPCGSGKLFKHCCLKSGRF